MIGPDLPKFGVVSVHINPASEEHEPVTSSSKAGRPCDRPSPGCRWSPGRHRTSPWCSAARVLLFLKPVSAFRAEFCHPAPAWHQGDGDTCHRQPPSRRSPLWSVAGASGVSVRTSGKGTHQQVSTAREGQTDTSGTHRPFPGAVRGQDTSEPQPLREEANSRSRTMQKSVSCYVRLHPAAGSRRNRGELVTGSFLQSCFRGKSL